MPELERPDPDALIAQLRAESDEDRPGRLRIYFGANAGVGKTWSMLSAAQRERQRHAGANPQRGLGQRRRASSLRRDRLLVLVRISRLPRRRPLEVAVGAHGAANPVRAAVAHG